MIEGAGSFISITMQACANFGTQYNFNSIAVALLIMSLNECTLNDDGCREGEQASWVRSVSSAVIFIGAIIGQVSMGFLGDFLSRNNAMACTLLIASISALLSAILPNGNATTVYAIIIVCRLFLGVGLGGIFPLSATKAGEDTSSSSSTTDDKVNPIGSSWAFYWQMPGFWRFLLGLGALPLLISSALLWFEEFLKRKQGATWFLFDIVAYGAALLSSLRAIFSKQMIALVTYTPGCLIGILGYPLVLGICAGVSFLSAVVSQVYIDEELLNKTVSFESLKIKPPLLAALNSSIADDNRPSAIHLSDVQPSRS
eukprot:gene29808-38960_t